MHPNFCRWVLFPVAMGLIVSQVQAGNINPDAVAFQNNTFHDGAVTFQNFSTTPVKLWSTDLGGVVSYPLIAQSEVFVTAHGTTLYALDARTGKANWTATVPNVSA